MQFHPTSFQEERWENADDLKSLIEKHSIRIGDEFPSVRYNYQVYEWGICSHEMEDIFGLTRSGLFIANRVFREDTTQFKNPWQPNPDILPGQWFEFQWNMAQVIEFFMFMSRFCHEYQAGEEIVYDISASPLVNRVLVSVNPRIHMIQQQAPCRGNVFLRKRTVPVEYLRSTWEDECAKTLFRLFELLSSRPMELSTFQKWIERFKNRTFWN